MPAEIELKLAFPPQEARALLRRLTRHPAVAAKRSGRSRTTRLVSTYYDTPDERLAAAGIALRLRRDGQRWMQTVKGPPLAGHGGGMHARDEHEWPLASGRLDPAYFAATPWHALLAEVYQAGTLAPRFTTDFERHKVPLAWADGTTAELCIDVGAIRVNPRVRAQRVASRPDRSRVPIAEIEIELATGQRARLFELAEALAADLPLAVAAASKAERGHALAGGRPDGWYRPVRAEHVDLAKDATTAEAIAAVAGECLRHIAANALGLVYDRDPEWVHQMRVGTRRLRSCLSLDAGAFSADRLALVLAEIKWLAGLLGEARDWDVFATQTLPPLAAHFAHEPATANGLRRLRARAAARRRAAHEAAVQAVASPRFQQLVLATGALVSQPREMGAAPDAPASTVTVNAGDPSPTAAASTVTATAGDASPTAAASAIIANADDAAPPRGPVAATEFARALLSRRHRKLAKRSATLEHATRAQRHAARIAAKKLRYAAEFFAPLFDDKRARGYLQALSGLQDVLGRFNDGVTATRLALDLDRGADSGAAGIVRGWVAAQSAALEPELAAAQEGVAEAKRFWK